MSRSTDHMGRMDRANRWLSAHAWVWIMCLALAVVLLASALLAVVGRVTDNATKLRELQYQSCIHDAELNFKIAEGDLIKAAFEKDPPQIDVAKQAYDAELDNLRGTQAACRSKFPA